MGLQTIGLRSLLSRRIKQFSVARSSSSIPRLLLGKFRCNCVHITTARPVRRKHSDRKRQQRNLLIPSRATTREMDAQTYVGQTEKRHGQPSSEWCHLPGKWAAKIVRPFYVRTIGKRVFLFSFFAVPFMVSVEHCTGYDYACGWENRHSCHERTASRRMVSHCHRSDG